MDHNVTNATGTGPAAAPPFDPEEWDAFGQTLVTNCASLAALVLVFSLAHGRCQDVYVARWSVGQAKDMVPPTPSCWGWLPHVLSLSNDRIFRDAGLDALALIMLVEMSLELFTLFMVVNLPVLTFGLRKITMEGFCPADDALWAHWTLALLMVAATLWLMHVHWFEFSKYRRRYFVALRDAAAPVARDPRTCTIPCLALHGRTVVVDGIPAWMNSAEDPDRSLYQFFDALFPGKVDSAVVARDPGKELTALIAERDAVRDRLEAAHAAERTALADGKPPPQYSPPLSLAELKAKAKRLKNAAAAVTAAAAARATGAEEKGKGEGSGDGDGVDAAAPSTPLTDTQGIRKELDALDDKLAAISTSLADFKTFAEPVGYVTFLSVVGRSLALQNLLTTPWDKLVDSGPEKYRTAPDISVRPAPEPRDIVHSNVGARSFRVLGCSSRVALMRFAAFWLLCFWAIPVALITSLTQLEVIEEHLPFLKVVTDVEVVHGFLAGFLPTLALLQFMNFLPKIFAYMAKLEGAQSFTDIEKSATARFVAFQIINVLFVSALTGGLWQTIGTIGERPGLLVDLLGSAMPGQAVYMTSYIMLMGFGLYPLELAQPFPLVIKRLKMKRAKTERAWDAASAPPAVSGGYAKQYGYVLLAFAISMEFATIAPMLLPFSVLFFGFSYVVLRHHVYYLWKTERDGMGKMWPWLMACVVVIIVVCQITLIGIFYAREAELQATLTWPVVFLVVYFYFQENRKHEQTFATLSLQEMKKTEDTTCTKLVVVVHARSYAWMATHGRPSDATLREGLSVDMPAAWTYLHPVILRHRLGRVDTDFKTADRQAADRIARHMQLKTYSQTSQHIDLLSPPRRLEASIFGRTFRKMATFRRNSSRRIVEQSNSVNGPEEGDGGSKTMAGVEMRSPASASASKNGSAAPESITVRIAEPAVRTNSAPEERRSGGGERRDSAVEEIPGGVLFLKSRWRVWAFAMLSATAFVVGTFEFVRVNTSSALATCSKSAA